MISVKRPEMMLVSFSHRPCVFIPLKEREAYTKFTSGFKVPEDHMRMLLLLNNIGVMNNLTINGYPKFEDEYEIEWDVLDD